MSIEDLKHVMPNSFTAKILATVLTAGISGGSGWIISTTVGDHSSISVLTEDIHNLIGAVRDSKNDTDSEINRVVNIQEQQDREISRLEQAMQDRLKTEFGPR